MGVEKWKIGKNVALAMIIAFVGLETGMPGYQIIVLVLAVGAPDVLELYFGNGLKISLEDGGGDQEGSDDEG